MGISGLLPLLKSIHRPTELKKFAGEALAIDAYGWLHRGAVACALELAQGKPTRKYVDFAMHRVKMVKYFGATPYLVFDGDFLPSKALTETSREKRREESKKAGMELLKAGKPSQAYLEFQKAIDVTPEMARHLIEELKKADIPYIVAPYEADAQMVYLERHGYVSGIISEDSDLLVFGAKRLLTKLDQHGQCIEINRRDFCAVREISLIGWTDAEFRQMAIFSGCDYLDSVNNMGLKTAYRMIRKHKTPEKVIRMLQFDGKHRVSENYLASFKQAELTFLHQRVYCPKKQELVLLTEPTSGIDVEEMPFIGAKVDPELARAIAVGDVNPITKQPIILPNAPSSRTRTLAESIQKKPIGKPIDQYFKGQRRIPMGEMDTNCFTVDPQQAATRTANGLAPRVFPLPRPYLDDTRSASSNAPRPYTSLPRLNRRRTEPITNLIGLGTAVDTNRRRTAGSTAFSTSPRPPKKARLCEELDTANDAEENALPETSKFFPPPTAAKTPKSKRRSGSFLMSDDSLDNALLALPDFGSLSSSQSNKLKRPMAVFRDSGADEVIKMTPQKPAPSAGYADTPGADSDEVEVPASSPVKVEVDLESERSSRVGAALGRFAYTPQVSNLAHGTRMAFGLPTPDSSGVSGANGPASFDDTKRPPFMSADTPMLTPLQRVNANGTLNQSPSKHERSGDKAKLRRGLRRSLPPNAPVNPAFVPLPKVNVSEVMSLNRPMGSEDLIVPNSDGENEPESPKVVASRNLDLSRFLCR